MSASRLLKPSELPRTLWDAENGILALPHALANAYTRIIDINNLRTLSASRDRDNAPVGGLTQAETDTHFAQAFDGSAARAMLAILDPYDHLTHVSNTFVEILAGDCLCLVDAPCGAGATTYAFLTAIADLRESGILPRIPLDVCLVGADLSQPARTYASELFSLLRHRLEEQAIVVNQEFRPWDATDKMSTTELVARIIELSPNRMRRLVLVSNFSGFLERENKRKLAEPRLEELFRYLSRPGCAALWIEPQMNVATAKGGLFTWLIKKVTETWFRWMAVRGQLSTSSPCLASKAKFRDPLDADQTRKVHVAVVPISLEEIT